MKREILFRGINVDNCKWVEGHYFTHTDSCTNCCISDYPNFVYDVIPETVGQFTGLLDKNGKKIFEGDILGGCNGSINGIEWKQKEIIVKFEHGFFNIPLLAAKEQWDNTHYLVVIGNIHDNPELLENA